jgi:hypothetical protein
MKCCKGLRAPWFTMTVSGAVNTVVTGIAGRRMSNSASANKGWTDSTDPLVPRASKRESQYSLHVLPIINNEQRGWPQVWLVTIKSRNKPQIAMISRSWH